MVNINPYPKSQHTAPKIEEIKIGEVMAITLNPMKEADPTKPLMAWIKGQYNYLQQHAESGGYKLILYPEASPLGKMHMHGYVAVTDYIKWIQKGVILLKDLNSFAIKKFFKKDTKEDEDDEHTDGQETWQKYCTKQEHIIKPLFENNVLDYPLRIGFNNDEEEGGSGSEGSAPPPPPSTIEPRPKFKEQEPKQRRKTVIKVIAKAP